LGWPKLSKIIENYRKLSIMTREIIVIDKNNLLSNAQHYLWTTKMVTHSKIVHFICNFRSFKKYVSDTYWVLWDIYKHCKCLIRAHCSIVTVQVNWADRREATWRYSMMAATDAGFFCCCCSVVGQTQVTQPTEQQQHASGRPLQ
jgi:hypothetical protein